jgi:hypothetical protein
MNVKQLFSQLERKPVWQNPEARSLIEASREGMLRLEKEGKEQELEEAKRALSRGLRDLAAKLGIKLPPPKSAAFPAPAPSATPATLEHAEKLFGLDFLGPKQLETAWGFKLKPGQIPAIPFSPERLSRAKQLGMMLVLHAGITPEGSPMTMKAMKTLQGGLGWENKLLRNDKWCQEEEFYKSETPRLGWRLESKAILPDSTNKNEVQQLELLAAYLKNTIFAGTVLPADYASAIAEFEAKKAEITKLMVSDKDWPQASAIIQDLSLCKLTRAVPAELIQTIETHHQNTGEYLLPDVYARTPRRRTDGGLVSVGRVRADGVYVHRYHPGPRGSDLGVALSLQS